MLVRNLASSSKIKIVIFKLDVKTVPADLGCWLKFMMLVLKKKKAKRFQHCLEDVVLQTSYLARFGEFHTEYFYMRLNFFGFHCCTVDEA